MSIGIEVIAAVTIGIIAGNATADWQKDWQLHDPKKNDRQNMEDGLGWTANSNNTFIWRGKPNNEPKGICNTPSKFMKCLGVGLGFGDIIREAVNCFADGGACVDEKQPGQLVLQTSSSTPTLTITPSVTLTPNCSPPYQQCNATMTATFTVTQTSTSTATPTNTAIPSPTSTPTIKPSPIRTLRTLMPY